MIAAIDMDAVERGEAAGSVTPADLALYRTLADDVAAGRLVLVSRMAGTFGPLGQMAFDLALIAMDGQAAVQGDLSDTSSGAGRRPADAWTAIRLLTEGSDVTLTFRRQGAATARPTLTAPRARYLDDNGALAAVFLPGELTQSLCSPWTHDFRDCGCFYWASNHPDIAQPLLPGGGATGQSWQRDVPWERSARVVGTQPPEPATGTSAQPIEMRHYEINNRWQELHFVVGRREVVAPYTPGATAPGVPLPNLATLIEHLRYAAGVELAVAQEYLCAAYSLKPITDPGVAGNAALRDDIRASRAELMRIAIGEMRHTRAVNDIIRGMMPAGTFEPALRVASRVPGAAGQMRDVSMRAATKAAVKDFIEVEAPSAGVDGLYSRILATLVAPPADVAPLATDEWREAVRSIIAEGEDHYPNFSRHAGVAPGARGNGLSAIGRATTPACRTCDAPAIADSLRGHARKSARRLPEGPLPRRDRDQRRSYQHGHARWHRCFGGCCGRPGLPCRVRSAGGGRLRAARSPGGMKLPGKQRCPVAAPPHR